MSCIGLQAMDRCHRIGQTRPVLVFRLATAGSVEGKLLARAGYASIPHFSYRRSCIAPPASMQIGQCPHLLSSALSGPVSHCVAALHLEVNSQWLVRCRSKLLLEKLVIKKGSVLEGDGEKDKAGGGMTATDLLDMLKAPVDAKADLAQSGVVDDEVRLSHSGGGVPQHGADSHA
jgi:hypothetical protein